MQYCSTRNSRTVVSSAQAIAQGIAGDGGLFVPQEFPRLDYSELLALSSVDYAERADRILRYFLTDFTDAERGECVRKAYDPQKFSDPAVAPVAILNNSTYLLELWHGPTCAFKDMALQILPHLMKVAAAKTCAGKTVVILVATSGDTGKAALEGFQDVEGTKILVFYPEDGVSAMQKLQMRTQEGQNVGVCAIHGNFDDAQTGVKRIFGDAAFASRLAQNGMLLSSANSINWGRLLPQIVYYFSAYCELMKSGEMDYEGEEVNFVVPTGNFGNILAAYYAKQMGLPIHRLICASNQNHILTDFIRTGVYDRNREFYTSISPSMDILISSNLERLLYDLSGRDDGRVRGWMENLRTQGRYEVDADVKARMGELFYGGFATEEETKQALRGLYESEGYLCDPHTAVAVQVYAQYRQETEDVSTPTILVSTASPYKFAGPVLQAITGETLGGDGFEQVEALAAMTGAPVPAPIEALKEKEIRFSMACEKQEMPQAVLTMLGLGGEG